MTPKFEKKKPLELAIEHNMAKLHSMPEWAVASLPPETILRFAMREKGAAHYINLLDRNDLSKGTRQSLVDAIADYARGQNGMLPVALSPVIGREVYDGRVEMSPPIAEFLKSVFARGEAPSLELTAIAMLFDNARVGLEPSNMAAALLANWPAMQSKMRKDTAAGIANVPAFYARGVLTYDTPWDSMVETARPPTPGRREVWLAPPEKRTLPGDWLAGAARVLARVEGRDQDSLWHRLSLEGSAYKSKMPNHERQVTNMPPRNDVVFDEILRDIHRGRRARDLVPLVLVAKASLVSEPEREPARIVAALLGAFQKFPSLEVNWKMLLFLLPLTPETRTLWWDLALTALQRGKYHRTEVLGEIIVAHRAALLDASPDLFVPPANLVERYRGSMPNGWLNELAEGPAMAISTVRRR